MEAVTVALGSNLGDRLSYLRKAALFLDEISEIPVRKSSIWESEPIGNARYTFYNCVAVIGTSKSPAELLKILKTFEQTCGREANPERWGPRILDLDIIRFGERRVAEPNLVIPHPEYHRRRFVLLPVQELEPGWTDPQSGKSVKRMIEQAPPLKIKQTDLDW